MRTMMFLAALLLARADGTEVVKGYDQCISVADCEAFKPFSRPWSDPMAGPIYWLISTQGHACLISGREYVGAQLLVNKPYRCHEWRMPR